MSNTKSPIRSKNMWTGIATILAGGFAYFSIAPDLSTASVLADSAHTAVEGITTKNYALLFGVVVNAANILYHLFKTKA